MPTRTDKFREFAVTQVERLGSFDYDGNALLWHYTTGAGLKATLESGTLFCTQVSCLNDSTEIRYAVGLFKKALTEVLSKYRGDERVKRFLTRYLKLYDEEPEFPEEVLKDEGDKWENEFMTEWDVAISYLSPLVKDPAFAAENEYRIIHEFIPDDLRNAVFIQKKTMMTRHVSLSFPRGGEAWVPRLPIEKVMVGPCRHREITRISVDTLLRKMGYGGGKAFSSVRPFQET